MTFLYFCLALAAASARADSDAVVASAGPSALFDAVRSPEAARPPNVQFDRHIFSLADDDYGNLLEDPAAGKAPGRTGSGLLGVFLISFAGAAASALALYLKTNRKAGFASRRWSDTRQIRSFPGTEPLAGKYVAVCLIGRGGTGEVWQARDRTLDRPVAVKTLWPDLGQTHWTTREQRREEARTAATLHHPNIGDVYEIVEVPSSLYLISEFVSGATLRAMLVKDRRLPLAQTQSILGEVCGALAHAHERGLAHRSLSTSNIFVDPKWHVKVIDFALSYPSSAGPRSYAPPEGMDGAASTAADIYAMGVCLFEMLTGAHPLSVYSGSLVDGRRFPKPSALVPELPAHIDELADHAMKPDPASRLGTAREFLALLGKT